MEFKKGEIEVADKRTDKILKILEDNYPDAKTALEYSSPFQLLIAAMLSAQSTDKQVNNVTRHLFKKYKTAKDFASLEESELARQIRGVGLYRNKSKNIIAASKIIDEKFNGNVSRDFNDLIKLPGVGRKTANVVLSICFGEDALAVDTHVHRVSNRLGLASAKTPEKTEEDLKKRIPKHKWSAAHHWLINHGRRVCKARRPDCNKCNISSFCNYFQNKINKGQ